MPDNGPSQCLFLPELPSSLKDDELERHFRGFFGFISCRTRFDRNGKLVGFVEFETPSQATRAKESMERSSPFTGHAWLIHFSNNTKGGGSAPQQKRPRPEDSAPSRQVAPRPNCSAGPSSTGGTMAPPAAMSPYPSPQAVLQRGVGVIGYPAVGACGMQHAGFADPGQMQPTPNYIAPLPTDASSCLYVEGLPSDATEREVAHIFRRFEGQGYQSIRMIPKESGRTGGKLYLCFVEFDNAHQATAAMHQLQGYRFDKNVDAQGMRVSYSNKPRHTPLGRLPGRPSSGPPPPRPSAAPVDRRLSEEDRRGRGGYEEDERYDRGDHAHYRRGMEHRDSFHDDESEHADDEYVITIDQQQPGGDVDDDRRRGSHEEGKRYDRDEQAHYRRGMERGKSFRDDESERADEEYVMNIADQPLSGSGVEHDN